MKPATVAIHCPRLRRDGAIAPPIHLSTTYEHGPANEPLYDHEYIRDANPNVDDLEAKIAALEGADFAVVFGSGMAAAHAVLSQVPAGGKVLMHRNLYVDVKTLSLETASRFGITVERVDMTDLSNVRTVLSDAVDLIWFETPTNPRLEIIDIAAISAAARDFNAKVLVDGSIAPPIIQRPHDFGADIVLHSLTKYMGGHSDIQGGCLSFKGAENAKDDLLHLRRHTGGVLSPFNAWLVCRGLQSLDCRMARHCSSALFLAEALQHHPKVERIHYPYLQGAEWFEPARKQMSAGGGMMSLEIVGGAEAAIEVARNVRLFTNATSFGGAESLIEHRRSVEGANSTSPPGLLRISVGLEDETDLLEDLLASLATL